MNKKYILIIAILIIAAVGGIFFYKMNFIPKETGLENTKNIQNASEEVTNPLINDCEKITADKEVERSLCFLNLGKNNIDLDLCSQIKNQNDKSYCYGGVAGSKKDLSVCFNFQKDIMDALRSSLSAYSYPFNTLDSSGSIRFNQAFSGSSDSIATEMELNWFTPCYIGAAFVQKDRDVCTKTKADFCYPRFDTLLAITENNTDACDKISNNALCYAVMAAESKKTDLCNQLDKTEDKNACYIYLSRAIGSTEPCKQIQAAQDTKNLDVLDYKTLCYLEANKTIKDVKICDQMDDKFKFYKDMCYAYLAFELNNAELCKKTEGDSYSYYESICYGALIPKLADYNDCEKLVYYHENREVKQIKESCYLYFANKLKNPDLCAKTSEYEIYGCYADLSKSLKDETICDKAQDQEIKQSCRNSYFEDLSLEEKDINLCEKIQNNENNTFWYTEKDGCYFQFIQNKESIDYKICEKMHDSHSKNVCRYWISANLGDLSACEGAEDNRQCLLIVEGKLKDIAIEKQDINICDNLSDTGIKNSCYLSFVGNGSKDIKICEKIQEESKYITINSTKDYCYHYLAINLRDVNICNKVKTDYVKKECINYINAVSKLEKNGWRIEGVKDLYNSRKEYY